MEERIEIDIKAYYQKYGSMVFRRCQEILRNDEQANDATQEVFVRLLQNQDRLSGQYPSSLLYRMATNVSLNVLEYQAKFCPNSPEMVLSQIACHDEAEKRFIAGRLLDKIFMREKKSTREMAVLFYVDGLNLKEVAAEVGISVAGVRRRLASLKLKNKLGG